MVAQGPAHVSKLVMIVQDPERSLPDMARPVLGVLVDMLATLDERIKFLDKEIARRAKEDEVAHRLMTIPGIGPVIATALTALAPTASTFKRGRDFAAWLGIVT